MKKWFVFLAILVLQFSLQAQSVTLTGYSQQPGVIELRDDKNGNTFVFSLTDGQFRFRSKDDQFIGFITPMKTINCPTVADYNVLSTFDKNRGNFQIQVNANVCKETGSVTITEKGVSFTLIDTVANADVIQPPPVVVPPVGSTPYCASSNKTVRGWHFELLPTENRYYLYNRTNRTSPKLFSVMYVGVPTILEYGDWKAITINQKSTSGFLSGSIVFNIKKNFAQGVFFTGKQKITITDSNTLNTVCESTSQKAGGGRIKKLIR